MTLALTERKSFTAALATSALIVFALFALAIGTPGCAWFQKQAASIGPVLASCGEEQALKAAGQVVDVVADAVKGEDFQQLLAALEADATQDGKTGLLCAVQQIAFTYGVDAGGAVVPKYNTIQVTHARAYLQAHK